MHFTFPGFEIHDRNRHFQMLVFPEDFLQFRRSVNVFPFFHDFFQGKCVACFYKKEINIVDLQFFV